MALDNKAITTNGFWYTTAAELNVRIASFGYIGTATAPSIVTIIATAWLSLRSHLGLRH